MKQINFTSGQEACLNSTADAVLANSAPGSGKSEILLEAARRASNQGDSVLYLAYNKAIVEDIRPKMPPGVEVKTFHAFGLGLINANIGHGFNVDFNKYNKVRATLDHRADALKLCENHLSLDGNQTQAGWETTCDRFFVDKAYIPAAREIYARGVANKNVVSAQDMINEPVINNYQSKQYDLVLVDECHDSGPDKLALLSQIKTERIMLVGDENQMINSYCGSDPFIYEKLDKRYSPEKFSIDQSFRVPEVVLDEVRHMVPNIWSNIKGGSATSLMVEDLDVRHIEENSLIVCRANAPLFEIASKMIEHGMHFSMKLQTVMAIHTEMKYLYKKYSNLPKMKKAIDSRKRAEVKRYRKEGWNEKNAEAKFLAIEAVLNSSQSLMGINRYMQILINESKRNNKRRLCSIHTSKGLENENVYFLKPHLSRNIALGTKVGWRKQEEKNLTFVATTRSKRNLTYLHDES